MVRTVTSTSVPTSAPDDPGSATSSWQLVKAAPSLGVGPPRGLVSGLGTAQMPETSISAAILIFFGELRQVKAADSFESTAFRASPA